MTIPSIFMLVLLAIPTHFIWTVIHELSHLLIAKKTVGVDKYKFRPYPHKNNGHWVFGSVLYWPSRDMTERDVFDISIAPMYPAIVACFIAPLWALFPGFWGVLVWMFAAGGIMNVIRFATSRHKDSDVACVIDACRWPGWLVRALAFLPAICGILGLLL